MTLDDFQRAKLVEWAEWRINHRTFSDKLRGFVGLFRRATFQCEHEWGDDEDFVSCYETTIGGLENGTHRPITIQTRQWCLKCDATRRKPGSARPALRARESQP